MKWLTIPQIKRRSKTAKGALKVSYEHWCQLYDATAKELRAEIDRIGEKLYYSAHCGLCNYMCAGKERTCPKCVFTNFCTDEDRLWAKAKNALESWIDKEGDWHSWKRACKAVRDKLGELSNE